MAITYTTRQYSAGTTTYYAPGGTPANNPGNFLQEQLEIFVNGIGDANSIRFERKYNQHTLFTSTDVVRFLINTPEGGVGAAAGVQFGVHTCGTAVASATPCYHTWSASASNNGAGTFTGYGTSHSISTSLPTTDDYKYMIAYDLTATLPWFAYAGKKADGTFIAGETLHRIDSSVIDTKIYAYVPKAGKWLRTTWTSGSLVSYGNVATPNSTSPIEARNSGSVAESGGGDWGQYSSSRSILQFPTTMHGNMGFLGRIEPDSMGQTGSQSTLLPNLDDETMTVLGKTYTRFGQRWWVRTA